MATLAKDQKYRLEYDIMLRSYAEKEAQKAGQSISKIGKISKQTKKELDSVVDEVNQFRIQLMNTQVAESLTDEKLKSLGVDSKKLASDFSKLEIGSDKLKYSFGGLGKETNQTENKYKSLMIGQNKLVENSGKLKSSISELGERFGFGNAKAMLMKAGLLALVIVIGTSLYKAYNKAIEEGGRFEQSIANLNAIVNPSSEDIDKLSAKARELGKSTVFTADEAANAFTELGKLGLTTNEIIASSQAVLSLAAATGQEMAQTATVVAQTLGQFGLSADEATRVTDVMSKSFTTSALDMNKFSEAMKYTGPVAKSTKISLEETTGALAILANSAIDGSQAGTGLRRVMLELSDKSSDVSKALKAAGYGGTKTFTEKLAALSKMNLSAAQRTEMFGLIATTTAGVLIDNAKSADGTTKSIEYYTKALHKAAGTTQEMADKQLNSLQGQMKLVKSAASEVWLTLYETFGPQLKDLVAKLPDALNKVAESIKAWAPVLRTINSILLKTLGLLLDIAEKIPDTFTAAGQGLSLHAGGQENLDRFNEQNSQAAKTMKEYNQALKETIDLNQLYEDSMSAFKEGSISAQDLKESQDKLTISAARVVKLGKIGLDQEREAARLSKGLEQFGANPQTFFTKKFVGPEASGIRSPLDVGGESQLIDENATKAAAKERDEKIKQSREGYIYLPDFSEGGGITKRSTTSGYDYGKRSMLSPGNASIGGYRRQVEEEDTESFVSSMGSSREAYEKARKIAEDNFLKQQNALELQEEQLKYLREEASKSELQKLNEDYQKKLQIRKDYEASSTELTRDYNKKRAEIEKSQALQSVSQLQQIFGGMANIFAEQGAAYKTFAIAETIMSTSMAVMKAWSQEGIFAAPLAAIIAAQGALQIGKIASQSFFSGGLTERENSSDNIMIRAQRGEMIMSRSMVNNMANSYKENGTGQYRQGNESKGDTIVNQYFRYTDPIIASRRSKSDAERANRKRAPALVFGEAY